MIRLRIWSAAFLVVSLLLTATTAGAQSGSTGAISGEVKDPTGAAVEGARVVATENSTGTRRETRTSLQGTYFIASLPVGDYTLTVEADGFKRLVRNGIQVEAAVTRDISLQLDLGEVTEQIAVTEQAPLLVTEQATTFRQLNTTELLQVPSSSRNFTHLLSAEAGINTDLPPVLNNDNGSISPSVNGNRTTSNSLQFNGVDATNLLTNEGSLIENIAPAPETIQEVKLQTSLYDAATGRNGGGNFQIITKGGGNQIHGSAYWFFQNEALNANDFFFNLDGIDRPKADRQEYGFTLGGPVLRDKVFLFGGYQRTDAETGFVPTASSTVDLPLGLDFVSGSRTADALIAGFNQARAACGRPPLSVGPGDVSQIALNLFQLRNPATGGFIIPAPNRGVSCSSFDGDGNPVVRVRQVFPSEFQQDQFTLRGDVNVSDSNRLYAVFFFSNFPSRDAFPDPSSLASPFTLLRDNKARTVSIGNTHVFSPTVVNDLRFGMLSLDNTRSLDDPFLDITNDSVGVFNPAQLFDDSAGTRRLGHYVFRGVRHSFGGPNDSFNRREQLTFNVTDTLAWTRGRHSFRFGGEFRHHNVKTNLPEEQATEFEKFASFTQLLRGLATEADTQYGLTAKEFNMFDLAWFVADDWKLTDKLTFNLGLRWDWFAWPTEKNGLVGNFDPALAEVNNPLPGILIPSHAGQTGIAPIDATIAVTNRASTKHTLHGQDLNNFQPRFGFAWQPLESSRFVVRGGYGIFFDRPSAAFINTLFSNYPHLREVEITFPSGAVPLATAFSQLPTNLPFNEWFPFRVVPSKLNSSTTNYIVRDNTPVFFGADGTTPNPPCDVNFPNDPCRGSIAETLEFRAIDRDLKTPYVQHWNLGLQTELTRNLVWEVRYVGTKGTNLLSALSLAQPFDLNDPNVPDAIFARMLAAYEAAGSPRGPLGAANIPGFVPADACPGGQPSCLAGVGRAFGFAYPNSAAFGPLAGVFDMNLAYSPASVSDSALIPPDIRVPFLGVNTPEAIILKSVSNSIYHGLQTSLTQRFSRGVQFNLAYTFSRSIDDNSADPGSTAGGGKPDVPNTGFVIQGDSRNLAANRGPSDFDRTHRFSASFVWEIPTGGLRSAWVRGWQLSGFVQVQSGAPFSLFSPEPEAKSAKDLLDPEKGSGGLFRLGFGRPSLAPGVSISDLRNSGSGLQAFNPDLLAAPLGGFGLLGRNVLRGDTQKRVDMAISKITHITERYQIEFRTEFFNLFNNVNFALPVNDISDGSFGMIERTIGGPRVIQFGLRFAF